MSSARRGHDRSVFRKGERERGGGGGGERKREREFRKGESSFSTTRQCHGIENEVAAEFSFPRDTAVCFPPPPSAPSRFAPPSLFLSPVRGLFFPIVFFATLQPRSVSFLSRERRAATLLALVLPARAALRLFFSPVFLLPPSFLPSGALIRERRSLVSVKGRNKASLLRDDIARRDLVFLCGSNMLSIRCISFFFIGNSSIEKLFY